MMSFTRFFVCHVYSIFIHICFSGCMTEQNLGRWYSGRTPPSKFEYTGINGFYSPKQAQVICEGDIQCGGFTFKGTKGVTNIVPEVYFFHFIDERSNYLTPEIQNSHWTSYIVGSRDHIVISGSYPSIDSNKWRKLSRYGNFFSMSYKKENPSLIPPNWIKFLYCLWYHWI